MSQPPPQQALRGYQLAQPANLRDLHDQMVREPFSVVLTVLFIQILAAAIFPGAAQVVFGLCAVSTSVAATTTLRLLLLSKASSTAFAASIAPPGERLVANAVADQAIRVLMMLLPAGERELQRGMFAEEFNVLAGSWAKVDNIARLIICVLKMWWVMRSSRRTEISS